MESPPPRSLVLDLLGVPIELHIEQEAGLDLAVAGAWQRCWAGPDAQAGSLLTVGFGGRAGGDGSAGGVSGAAPDVTGVTELQVLDALTTRLTHEALKGRVGEVLLLHAAAVADADSGATIVLVAPSGTGKTSAAMALGRQFGYLSDEVAAIHPDGSVLAFPKPLSLLVDERRPKRQVSPTELGLLHAPVSPWLAGVALLDRTDAPGRPTVTRVRTVEALPALGAQSSSLHLLPSPLHLLADLLAGTGGLSRITYHEARDLGPIVAGLMGGSR